MKPGVILWHVTMSVDGFIAGPGGSTDWIFKCAGPNAAVDEAIRTIGSLLAGRRSYDISKRPGASFYGGAWRGPQFVLTDEPPAVPDDPTITFLSGDIRTAVARARVAADGKNVAIIGADVARQCMDAGLIDEILIHLVPVLLGDGIRFFARPGTPIDLEKTSLTEAGQLVNLRFRVLK